LGSLVFGESRIDETFPGRFIIKTRISARDPVTGEADVDTRNFRLKR